MKLLNTTTHQIHEFIRNSDIPPYAILSHTWGDEEVTFPDIRAGNGWREKQGGAKILFCCTQVKSDGYEWVWIDTCCIDKTSSAELSEAIKSMWSWYKASEICYAYLADVDYDKARPFHRSYQFSRSKWFELGWTLQELLAPPSVEFFDRKWISIGTRSSRVNEISAITGIPEEALQGAESCYKYNVGCRMSWAARRRTTRPEDVAYCLLGLLGFNMPLLYGEGEERAFLRLQEEVIRQNDDHTLFVWDNPEPELGTMGLLAKSPTHFSHTRSRVDYSDLETSPAWDLGKKTKPGEMVNSGKSASLGKIFNLGSWSLMSTTIVNGQPDKQRFYMTGRGLSWHVPLRRLTEKSHQACLTYTKREPHILVCIMLEPDGSHALSYVRTGKIQLLAATDTGDNPFEFTSIYIRERFNEGQSQWKKQQRTEDDLPKTTKRSEYRSNKGDNRQTSEKDISSSKEVEPLWDPISGPPEPHGPTLVPDSNTSDFFKERGLSSLAYSSVGQDREARTESTSTTIPDRESTSLDDVGLYKTATVYSASVGSDLAPLRDTKHVTQLAEELSSVIIASEPNRGSLDSISQMLPDLLRAFSLKLGYNATTSMQRDIAYFIHRHRWRIQGIIELMLPDNSRLARENDHVQPGKFAIERFLGDDLDLEDPIVLYEGEIDSDEELGDDEDADRDGDEDVSEAYREIINNSPAYSWLLANLQREAFITRANPDLLMELEEGILSALPKSHTVSRRTSSQVYKAAFAMDWDPLLFLKQQGIFDYPSHALKRVVTLTGQMTDAQAATTSAYLSQTWPTNGKYTMQLVTAAAGKLAGEAATTVWPDGTEVNVRLVSGKTVMNVSGTADSVVEVGQQFGWLGAALRSSQFKIGVATCSPFIRNAHFTNSDPNSPKLDCQIGFCIEGPREKKTETIGDCWHDMFRNSMMVSGYPIRHRSTPHVGIEMPLNLMTALVGSQRVDEFDGKLFLKGFSTMLVDSERKAK